MNALWSDRFRLHVAVPKYLYQYLGFLGHCFEEWFVGRIELYLVTK